MVGKGRIQSIWLVLPSAVLHTYVGVRAVINLVAEYAVLHTYVGVRAESNQSGWYY